MNNTKPLAACMCCGNFSLTPLLDLGKQPLANSFRAQGEEQEAYPLATVVCEQCWHVQLTQAVAPEILFKNYLYVSGTSRTMREYAAWFARFAFEYTGGRSRVLEIGCNDGTQLDAFKALGGATMGIDPAENIVAETGKRHKVICDFLKPEHVPAIKAFNPDIIYAQNVFAHTDDPLGFLQTCSQGMWGETLLFIQNSQADMILNGEFDTIYHEHRSFFSVSSMMTLAQRVGLHVVDVVKTPIHGGSNVFVLSKAPMTARLENCLAMERMSGLHDIKTYRNYVQRCNKTIFQLKDALRKSVNLGFKPVGFGAPAKGMTLLNWGQIDLDFIVEDATLKQGTYTPGRNIPIYGQGALNAYKDQPIVWLVLAWNFFDEITAKIKEARPNCHDHVIRYFPEVETTII